MPSNSDVKNVQIQVYLLSESTTDADDAIRATEDDPPVRRELPPPLDGLLFTKPSNPHKPQWTKFLEDLVEEELSELETSSASALLIVRASDRYFALTYGYGRSLLDPSKIERSFGLRVALNAVDPEQLRAVDSRTVEEMTFQTRRQASRKSEVSAFGLDTSRDLLRGVTGIPREELVASRIAGAESVTLSAPLEPSQIPEQCTKLLELYSGNQYKERFEWIDRLQLVKDPGLKEKLNERLSEALAAGETDRMHLAPPETIDWQNVSGFYYWNPRLSQRYDDLEIDDALAVLSEHSRQPLSADALRRYHLYVEFREQPSAVAKYTVYSALVFETELDGQLFVLSDSDWHLIDKNWAASIRDEVAAIPVSDLPLPPAHSGEVERSYNERAAAHLQGELFDMCLIQHGPGRDKVEFCDILAADKKLVHVKRKAHSATLSHLFMQGLNAATLLAHDKEFRQALAEAAVTAGIDLRGTVPEDGIKPSEWEVVFGIITKHNPHWPRSLPFFSQLSLSLTAKSLAALGFERSLALIPLISGGNQ